MGVIQEAARAISRQLGGTVPKAAIVLGSGLGFLADEVRDGIRIPYGEIPGFPAPGVVGHKGEIVAGTLEGVPVLVQSGRFHLYEGHPADVAALPVRAFHRVGIRTLIVTNAAGGLRPTFRPGTLMLIADHVNLMFRNPLLGPVRKGEERFPDMSDAYDPGLRALAREVAREARIPLEEGVYLALLGPSFETPAEIRMLQRFGADAVGMSTVPEVITARALGVRCLGFSTITNLAAGISPTPLSHQEVLEVGRQVGHRLGSIVTGVVRRLPP
jgi:purine-nucleoside phosphorylase